MSNATTKNLSKEKVQQLLMAVGSGTKEDATQIESTEYNWHQPHSFNKQQLKKLDNFTKKMATAMAKKFTALCQNDFNVTITSTTQHYAGELLNQELNDEQGDYYMAFSCNQEQSPHTQNGTPESSAPCGLIGISLKSAIIWATQLLGDVESEENPDRDLSQLEESLLLDMTTALVEVFSSAHDNYDFTPAKNVDKGPLPLEVKKIEEFCKITFRVEKTDSENSSEAYFLILCNKLEPIVGKVTQTDNKFSAEDISKAILHHMQHIPVPTTAQLASTVFTFEEIMNLQTDDILLLNKKTTEPVELMVAGQPVFQGQFAKSAGKCAVVITEPICNTT